MRLRITTDDGHVIVETEEEVADLRRSWLDMGFRPDEPTVTALDHYWYEVPDEVAARFLAAETEYRSALTALRTAAFT